MNEIEQGVSEQLTELSSSAKKMLTTFQARINTLAHHKDLIQKLCQTLERLKLKPDYKNDQNLSRLLIFQIKNNILAPYKEINPQLAEHITHSLLRIQEDELIDIASIKEATKGIASELAKKRLESVEQKFKEHIKNLGKDITFSEHLSEIISLANKYVKEERELINKEISLISETEKTIGSLNDYKYDELIHNWKILIEEIEKILHDEKDKVIKQIDFLFQEDHSVSSLIKRRLESFRIIKKRPIHEELGPDTNKITEADIAQDLATLTKHAEVHEYVAAMLKHTHLMSPKARTFLASEGEIAAQRAEKREQELTETSEKDSLTKTYNRPTIRNKITNQIRTVQRKPAPFSVLYIDIDHFKKFNDTYGHQVGDIVLKQVTQVIQKNVSQIDFVGRLGGEELCVLLINANKEGATRAAERIREAVQISSRGVMDGINTQAKVQKQINEITISIGVSTYPEDGTDTDTLLSQADSRLYKAKAAGRNRVFSY